MIVSTSIGIVRPGPEHRSGADLLRDADNALYRAKERGRNQYVLFDATMGAETKERVALEGDLRRAIERDELRVLYQPKIDLTSGRVIAVEAFLRWRHPKRGWVPPSAFIPIAEEIGMIQQIGRWVLREACREAVSWSRLTPEPPILNVNLSGKQLHDPELTAELADLLEESGLTPNRLRLEITESVAMQNADATIQALWRLQKLGVKVVIDDFGTGYSSLSSLQRFPVDTLQLDSSFVANLGRSKEATTIAQAVIGLAHGLGLKVMAEGVERREQVAHLRSLGCEQAQGNLFSEPLNELALAAFLSRPVPPDGLALSDHLTA
jgi:EAL domain-containing protein (putative c-di-GMP-specific phosphodiesterase class I)